MQIKKNHILKQKAITLVELIVVITILAILWVISFISFQWYTRNSRDSLRITDLGTIQTSLELFITKAWFYPEPTYLVNIVYSWATVWEQWSVWDSMFTNISQLNKKPVDPITWSEYTYSVNPSKTKYQLATITEWWRLSKLENNIFLTKTYADSKNALAYVLWTYNWVANKVQNWDNCKIFWLPSIITSDLSITDLSVIINNWLLVYKWYWNIPSSYSWSIFKSSGGFNYNPTNLISYEDNQGCRGLITNPIKRSEALQGIQNTYSGILMTSSSDVSDILNIPVSLTAPTEQSDVSICKILDMKCSNKVVADLWTWTLPITWWWSDPVVVPNQVTITFLQANNSSYSCNSCQ